MNATTYPLMHRNPLATALAGIALVAGAALFTAPTLHADVHVGLSLGVELPHGYSEVRVGHDVYYTHHGVYYRHGPHGYVVVRAPRGAIVRALPPYYTRIYVGSTVYYRYDDVYYQQVPDGYVVVDPPVMQSPPPAPAVEASQSVWMGDREYIFKGGQFFTKTPDGLVWVPAPIGAVTQNLPPDVQSVWHEGIEYFETDEVYFRKTPEGYKVVVAPWKK